MVRKTLSLLALMLLAACASHEPITKSKTPVDGCKFLDAGLKLSVYNADLDVDMDYYLAYKDKLYAICTNYPRKLLGKWN